MAQYFTDFSDQTVGTFPTGWSGRITETTSWEIIEPDPAHGKSIASTTNTNTRKAITWDTPGTTTDVEIYYEHGSYNGASLGDNRSAARLDTSKNTSSATAHLYALGYSHPNNILAKYVNGSFTSVSTVEESPNPGLTNASTVYATRVRINGTSVKVRTWDTAGSEPGTWDLESTDSSIATAGAVGVFSFSNSTGKYWSAFGVGTDGDSAPTGPVDPGATITASGAVQGQVVGNVTLTQGYELAVSGLSQGQGAGAATLTQAHELTPNSVEQGHTVGQPAITQGHQIAPASVEQLQAIGVTELTQAHLIVPASLGQAQAIAMTTLIQAHVLGPEAVSHVQSLSSPSLTAAGDLVINALSQATGLGAVELFQANILTVDALEQGHALASVNVSQAGELLAAGLAHTQGLAASTLIQAHQVAVSNLAQAQTVEQVSLVLADLLDIDDLFQGQTADQATLTQAHILSAEDLTQTQLLQAVNFGGLVVGSLKGEIRIYALIDGALTIEPALKGNITIH